MSDKLNENENINKKLQAINPNFFTGIANGVLSMIGLGELYNVSGELQKASSDAQNTLQNSVNTLNLSMYNSLQNQKKLDTSLIKLLTQQKSEIDESINYYSTISKYSLYENNIFLKFVYILVFIIIFFMLIH
jgi:adenine-specific DNA methylase